MGSTNSVLNRNVSQDISRLYWPSPPYEGPMKLRFACAVCNDEAIELNPFPLLWSNLIKLEGICFKCGSKKRIHTKFLEFAKEREPLYVFNGEPSQKKELGTQLCNFLRTAPCIEAHNPAEVNFKRVCYPYNIRNKSLSASFIWPEALHGKELSDRRKALLQVCRDKLRKDRELWTLVIPSREDMLPYACKQFLSLPPEKIRAELNVKFAGEPALDLGGVMREFFSEVSKKILDPSFGLFVDAGPNHTLHPSPSSQINENHLDYFRFLGRLIGKALFEGVLVQANFTRTMFKLMLGKPVTFSDFQTVDKELYKHFKEIINYDEEILDSLSLDFTTITDNCGKKKVHELIPGGSNVSVNKSNLHEYIKAYSSWRMIDSVEEQIKCFLEGFYDIIPVQLLSFFTESELEMLLCGMPEIDVKEWRKNTIVINFPEGHSIATWFWEVVEEFDNHQRALIFHFATGTGRLLSFEHLNPPFTLYGLPNAGVDALPYGHTCFNRLDFPYYQSKDVMRQKLLAAINYGAVGFALE
eukprot:TRINITY_DN234_c0_g3_i1.p1 TRINITY_DN234_c0_g3~~TRINITY_DN234_c0_g3_i1.p1  ORF type:complete len:527 (-),score=97.83 TRINITY_DN234_c0_g3_i1:1076-2656(-)